jgi:ribosomal protein S27E
MPSPKQTQNEHTMKTIQRILLTTGLIASAMLLASCQAPSHPTSAVTCDKCRTVYFKAPGTVTPGNKGFVTLRDASRMDCPDCENQVVAWMKTGSLTKHVCKSCGGGLHHCSQH